MRAHRRLLRLQRRIHAALEAEVGRLLGKLPEPIVRYEKSYKESFEAIARKPRRSSRELLKRRMREADVVLVADYHTLGQAQRTALRLLQDAVKPGEKWLLGLEFVPSNRQAELDAFAAGLMDTVTFLKKIRYFEEWGFPWEHYAPLIEWARQNGVGLVALNRPRELPLWKWRRRGSPQDRDLVERDRWAAGIITDLLEFSTRGSQEGRARFFALYGELHVGDSHLPACIRGISERKLGSALRCVTVHQNNDELYWNRARRGPEHLSDVLELSGGHFHVISSTPWNKLQSVVSWAEGIGTEVERLPRTGILSTRGGPVGGSIGFDDDEWLSDLEGEALSRMQSQGEAMAEFLKLPAPSFDSVHLQSVHSADFIDQLRKDPTLSRPALRLLRELVQRNARFFLPWSKVLYIGTPSANGVAEMAALVLARGSQRTATFFGDSTDTFFQAVLDQAFGFFGSLLVNPRRKCDLPQDHLHEFLELRRRDPGSVEARARLSTLIALEEQSRFLERLKRMRGKGRHSGPGRSQAASVLAMGGIAEVATEVFESNSAEHWLSLWLCSRNLGQLLGKLLHQAVLHGEVSLEQVRELAWQASDRRWRPAEVRYWEWVAAVAGQTVPHSKRHMI